MSQVAKRPVDTPDALRKAYAPIREELSAVEELLRQELASRHAFVDELAKHGFRLGGKRLRPALVLLSGKACGAVSNDHVVLGAAMELIHTATLIHDDVLDEATMRRHLDTINARWDNEASILLGDYLLTRALCLASSLETPFACRAIGEASRVMCEGELRQIEGRGNFDLTEADYLDIIADKTAALCACCCRLGAHYADADPPAGEALIRFGGYLGIAFQIVDDLLDLFGDEASMGKSLGTDLLKQKPTLPLIRLLSGLDARERAKAVAVLTGAGDHHRDALRPWLERTDAAAYSRRKAMEYIDRAKAELGIFDAGPARDALFDLADFVLQRQH